MIATSLQMEAVSVTLRSDLYKQPCASLVLVRICRLYCTVDRCDPEAEEANWGK